MTKYFGPHHAFSTTAPAVPGVTRSYADFGAFIAEGLMARILGGMHFRTSLEEGQLQGKKVGNWVLEHYLVRVPENRPDPSCQGGCFDTERYEP